MKNIIYDSIAKGDIQSALEILKKLFDNNHRIKEVIVHSARYSSLKEANRLGVIDKGNEEILRNNITKALIELADEIETELTLNQNHSQPAPISFNIKKEKGINVVFKSKMLNREDDIVVPKNITAGELLEALKLHYDLVKVFTTGQSFDRLIWKLIINNMEYKGSLDRKITEIPIRAGDQIMIKGDFSFSIHGSDPSSSDFFGTR